MRSLEAVRRQRVLTALAACVGLASALNVGLAAEEDDLGEGLIQRVIAQTTRSGLTISARRHLEAGTLSGNHHGWMDVETTLAPTGRFSWNVIDEGGSDRTREKVFRAVLAAEAEAWRAGVRDSAALSPDNYEFVPLGETPRGEMRLQLKPKRADSKLVDGVLTVSSDGYPLLLEGRLAKSPSFWVKSVTVVKRYARVGGVALPVLIESLADVRLFGKSSFSMRYTYTTVNGRSVVHTAARTPASFGPSREILALHAQLNIGQ